jgi:hypothetical protein
MTDAAFPRLVAGRNPRAVNLLVGVKGKRLTYQTTVG